MLPTAAETGSAAADVPLVRAQSGDSAPPRRFSFAIVQAKLSRCATPFVAGAQAAGRCSSRCSLKRRTACCLVLTPVISLALALTLALAVLPLCVQTFMDAATISLVNCSLGPADATGIDVAIALRLDNGGPVAATIRAFDAVLHTQADGAEAGAEIGRLSFPTLPMAASAPTLLSTTSRLRVSSAAAFRAATAPLLRGEASEWVVRGEATVQVLGRSVRVRLRKRLRMPSTRMEEMRATDVSIERGDNATGVLTVASRVSFFSRSSLELVQMGALRVHAYYDAGANDPAVPAAERRARAGRLSSTSVRVGTVVLPNYELRAGYNELEEQIHFDQSLGVEAQEAIGHFFGRWLSGYEQTLLCVGPVGNEAAFLDNISVTTTEVLGVPTPLFTGGLMAEEHTVRGWDVTTGANCDTFHQQAGRCVKGAVVYGKAPGMRSLLFRDLVYDAFFDAPFEYSATMRVHAGPLPIKFASFACRPSDKFARLRSVPGMWAFAPGHNHSYSPDPAVAQRQRLADSTVVLEGRPTEGAFFLAAEPQPGQANETDPPGRTGPCVLGLEGVDPFDCCFTTRFTAAACYYQARGEDSIPITASGNATLVVDDWELPAANFGATIARVPIGFTSALTDFRVGINGGGLGRQFFLEFTCEDIAFPPA